MSEITTTLNGKYEIKNNVPIPDAEDFKRHMGEVYGFDGETPFERAERLREMSVEGIAILLEDINKQLQGSGDSLMNHDEVMKIGGVETLQPEDRYDVFARLVEDIKACPHDTNPARIGDVLALGVVLLHPFHDGNGRTSRAIGMLFRDDYDAPDFAENYRIATEGRDKARAKGAGWMIYGYVPHLPEGADQSNPDVVSEYLHDLLYEDKIGTYVGTYGPADLKIA